MRSALLLLLAAACGRDAVGDSEETPLTPPKPPCENCTVDVPSRPGAVPLLVVLHGNHESADDAAARWRAAALARGWAVLSLDCPDKLGCDDVGRWYRWRGDADWVFTQVSELAQQRDIDPSRQYLVGWSGGASYMGLMAARWPQRFAAVVFHGGGQPPRDKDQCPRDLPAYFLVGDRNPAHPAAIRLREYWEACGQEVQWDLLPGANHAKEDKALDEAKATAILEWLDRRSRAPLVSSIR